MLRASPLSGLFAATLLVAAALFAVAAGIAQAQTADENALHGAAWDGRLDEVERLLEKGTDPDVPNQNGWTAVHHAADRANALVLKALLEAGGNPDSLDVRGRTPMHLAAIFPYDEQRSQFAIQVLLRYGARPDLADSPERRTPLFVVAGNHRQPTSARDLLAAGADPNTRNFAGMTPLHAAVGSHSKLSADMVEALVDGGADGNVRGGSGETPLQFFVRVGSNDGRIVDALVDAGADVDAKNPDGESPVHTAIRNGGSSENNRVVEALLAAGADPCIRDASGYIPYNTAREGGEVHTMLANAGGSDIGCQGSDAPAANYVVDPADWPGELTTRSNVRSGPGTDYAIVSTHDGGASVHVTGTVRNGDWLQVEVAGASAFVHATLVREVESMAAAEAIEREDAVTQATDPFRVETYKLPQCVNASGDLPRLPLSQLYPALERGVCVGMVEVALTATCDTRTSTCGWPCPLGDQECYASWTHLPEWPYDDYEDDALALAAEARADPGSVRDEGLAGILAFQEFLRSGDDAAATGAIPIDNEAAAQVASRIEEHSGESATAEEDVAGAGTTTTAINTEPKCEDVPEGHACWYELEAPTGCRVYWANNYRETDEYQPEPTRLFWSGSCSAGVATGEGTLELYYSMDNLRYMLAPGDWVEELAQGDELEWVETDAPHWSFAGNLDHGVRQGHWVETECCNFGAPIDFEGHYVAGKRDGRWVVAGRGTGATSESYYLDGERTGDWTGDFRFETWIEEAAGLPYADIRRPP